MIYPRTIASLLQHQHQLAAYCQHCDRWAVLDLATMIAAGYGERRLPIRVRCRDCGALTGEPERGTSQNTGLL